MVAATSAGTRAMMESDRVQLSITCRRTAHDVSAAAK